MRHKAFLNKIAKNLSKISRLYFSKAPKVKLVENSIFQKQWEGILSEAEKEMLKELEKR